MIFYQVFQRLKHQVQIDKKLIKKVIKGDRRSQLELYHLCFNNLMNSAYRYYKNEEDAVSVSNAAFLKIVTKLDTYQDKVPFKAWIKRIVLNEIIDEYRRNKKRNDLIVPICENQKVETQIPEVYYDVETEYLENMLSELPKATRTVFVLYVIEGFSQKEISNKLMITKETTKWHLREARKRLRIMLTKDKS